MRTDMVKRIVAATAVAGLSLSVAAEPILLQAKTIRPEEESARPRLLSASPVAMPPMAVYLVQHDGQIPVGWRKKIVNAGGKIYGYIPNNAYLVGIASTNYAAFAADAAQVRVADLWREFRRNGPLRWLALFFVAAFALMSAGNAAGAYFMNGLEAQAPLAQEGIRWLVCVVPSALMAVAAFAISRYRV